VFDNIILITILWIVTTHKVGIIMKKSQVGVTMKPSRESNAMKVMFDVMSFMTENKRLPVHNTGDAEESRLSAWILAMKAAKNGKNSRVFYPILDEIAIRFNVPDLFKTKTVDDVNIEHTIRVIGYIKANGAEPYATHVDADIKFLGIWLRGMRKAKIGKGNEPYSPVLEKCAADAGFPNLFDIPLKKKLVTKKQVAPNSELTDITQAGIELPAKAPLIEKPNSIHDFIIGIHKEMQELRSMVQKLLSEK